MKKSSAINLQLVSSPKEKTTRFIRIEKWERRLQIRNLDSALRRGIITWHQYLEYFRRM